MGMRDFLQLGANQPKNPPHCEQSEAISKTPASNFFGDKTDWQ
jgi:hypothetical protein